MQYYLREANDAVAGSKNFSEAVSSANVANARWDEANVSACEDSKENREDIENTKFVTYGEPNTSDDNETGSDRDGCGVKASVHVSANAAPVSANSGPTTICKQANKSYSIIFPRHIRIQSSYDRVRRLIAEALRNRVCRQQTQ